MNRPTLHWGIIGPGNIAHKFASDLSRIEGAVLKGVASRDYERARTFGATYGASLFFSDYREMAHHPDIDLIYIATPHPFHYETTIACLKAGKGVLCEKPMAMNARQVTEMILSSRSHQSFLMEGLWTRFIPCIDKMLELIPRIGSVKHIDANFGFRAEDDPNSRLFNRALGGGALLDIGIYPVYLSLLILGTPMQIRATGTLTPTQVDSSCEIECFYENDARSSLFATFTEDTSTEAIIKGSKGYIRLHSRFHHPEQLTLHTDGQESITYSIPYLGYGYTHQIQHVQECVTKGLIESPLVSHEISLKLVAMLDEIRKSIGVTYPADNT